MGEINRKIGWSVSQPILEMSATNLKPNLLGLFQARNEIEILVLEAWRSRMQMLWAQAKSTLQRLCYAVGGISPIRINLSICENARIYVKALLSLTRKRFAVWWRDTMHTHNHVYAYNVAHMHKFMYMQIIAYLNLNLNNNLGRRVEKTASPLRYKGELSFLKLPLTSPLRYKGELLKCL